MDDGNYGDSWLVLMYGELVILETQEKNMMNAQCGGMKLIIVSCVIYLTDCGAYYLKDSDP